MISRKPIFIVGTITYAILFVLSIVFYLERTALFDVAYHLFFMAKEGNFVADQRFIKILPQLPTLLAIKLGLSLEFVAKTYSASFVLLQYIIFVVLIRWLKSNVFAVIMLLFSILMVTEVFYWMISEYRMGIWLCILYFGLLSYYRPTLSTSKKLVAGSIAFILLFFMVSSYLLIVIPFFYLTFFLWLDHFHSKKLLGISTLLFALFFALRYYFFTSSYEYERTENISNYNMSSLSEFFKLPSTINFWEFLLTDYYMLIVCGLAAIIFYLWKRSFSKLVLMLGAFSLNLVLVNINWPYDVHQFYIENPYLGLSLIVIVPFAFDLLKELNNRTILITLVVIISIRLVHIINTHDFYTERIDWMRNFAQSTEQMERKKLIVAKNSVPQDTLLMTWAIPFEFWVLSTIETGETRSILVIDDPQKKEDILYKNNMFFIPNEELHYDSLPERFFKLNDTTQYQIIVDE